MKYELNEYGLRQKDMEFLLNAFAELPEIEKVVVYGSRARGDYRNGSDLDLAIFGSEVSSSTILRLSSQLNGESPLLIKYDVLSINTLTNENLLNQITIEGKIMYERKI